MIPAVHKQPWRKRGATSSKTLKSCSASIFPSIRQGVRPPFSLHLNFNILTQVPTNDINYDRIKFERSQPSTFGTVMAKHFSPSPYWVEEFLLQVNTKLENVDLAPTMTLQCLSQTRTENSRIKNIVEKCIRSEDDECARIEPPFCFWLSPLFYSFLYNDILYDINIFLM